MLETVQKLAPSDAEKFLKDLIRERPRSFRDPDQELSLRVLTGLSTKVSGSETSLLKSAARLTEAVLLDPARAWLPASKASDEELGQLDPRVAFLLAAEYHRAGDPRLATRLLGHAQLYTTIPAAAAWRFVDKGEESEDVREIDGTSRAALLLARARAVEAAGGDGAVLRQKIDHLVPLGGPIAMAARPWPKGQKAQEENQLDAPIVFKLVTR